MWKGLMAAVLIAGAGVAAWVGAEDYVARRMRAALDDMPRARAGAVLPLRDPTQWGMRLQEVEWAGQRAGLTMDWAQVSVAPLDPFRLRMAVPDAMRLTVAGRSVPLELTDPEGAVDFAPLRRMAPAHALMRAGAVTSDGVSMLAGGRIDARLAQIDPAAPMTTLAAYDIDLDLDALEPAALALAGLPVPDAPISVAGQAQLWLDGTPGPLSRRAPRPTGFRSDGVTIALGAAEARVIGQVGHDAEGRAEGQVAVYTADADAFLDQAVALGLMDGSARMILGAGLRNIAGGGATDFPEPAAGELRLLMGFEGGRTTLGGMPIGPAPLLRPQAGG